MYVLIPGLRIELQPLYFMDYSFRRLWLLNDWDSGELACLRKRRQAIGAISNWSIDRTICTKSFRRKKTRADEALKESGTRVSISRVRLSFGHVEAGIWGLRYFCELAASRRLCDLGAPLGLLFAAGTAVSPALPTRKCISNSEYIQNNFANFTNRRTFICNIHGRPWVTYVEIHRTYTLTVRIFTCLLELEAKCSRVFRKQPLQRPQLGRYGWSSCLSISRSWERGAALAPKLLTTRIYPALSPPYRGVASSSAPTP